MKLKMLRQQKKKKDNSKKRNNGYSFKISIKLNRG